jgi:hypothetical protein
MPPLDIEFSGGISPRPFRCTGCNRRRVIGDDVLDVRLAGFRCGPLCMECWPRLPGRFEALASDPRITLDLAEITERVMRRYRAAFARRN